MFSIKQSPVASIRDLIFMVLTFDLMSDTKFAIQIGQDRDFGLFVRMTIRDAINKNVLHQR